MEEVVEIVTGIGSRKAKDLPEVYSLGEGLGYAFACAGWLLRSGGADGMDDAFEKGALRGGGRTEIYLASRGDRGHPSPLYGVDTTALQMAARIHPKWEILDDGARKLHGRNCYQVLGRNLKTPAGLVVCWTEDGCESRKTRSRKTGGTATAIVLADDHGIPVYNLANDSSRRRLNEYLESQRIAYRLPVSPMREQVQVSLFG